MEIVEKCLKFLISIELFSIFIYHFNIRFPYSIRKVVMNISINILSDEEKRL